MQMEKHVANFSNQRSLGLLSDHEVITVPVVVHVLHTGQPVGTGRNISVAQIQSQIDVLNEDFRRLNADASNTPLAFQGVASDPEIEFVLACVDPNGNPSNGIVRVQTNVNSFTLVENPDGSVNEEATGIKFAPTGSPAWPADRYLNIWVCNLGNDLLGYAQFPDMMATQPETDGVVVRTSSFGRTGNLQAPFDLGRTATHEVGHWLNLWHVWGEGGCASDDFVIDTPNQFGPNFNCPSHPQVSCSSNDMFMNYMDYTDDGCMNIFTEGQTDRMRALFSPGGFRESFVVCDFIFQICNLQPTISGPDYLCSTNIFTLQNAPVGSTVSWTVSPTHLFSASTSGSSSSAQLSPSGFSASGQATITFEIETDCGEVEIQRSFWVGRAVSSIEGPYEMAVNTVENYFATGNPYMGITDYQWSVFPSGYHWIGNQGTNGITLSFSATGLYSLELDVVNPCGARGSEIGIYVYNPWEHFTLYPNPTSDILHISMDLEARGRDVDQDFEVSLYDGQGRELIPTKPAHQQTSLNLSRIPKGFYYVHIRYKDALLRRQIRVER
jgi:hypothetical protein